MADELLEIPPLRPGENSFTIYIREIANLLFPRPTSGFFARLIALWTLEAYVVVVSALHLGLVYLDYRRRGKKLWIWRLVSRSNGKYIVANQHLIFSMCSLISAAVLIGYTINCNRTLIHYQAVDRAYWWRSLIWIPLLFHGWMSSWANLQAAVLSSQRASNTHLLSPRLANSLYIGGFVVMMVPVIVLDCITALRWNAFWKRIITLYYTLIEGREDFAATGVIDMSILALASREVAVATEKLDSFQSVRTASSAIYSVSTACLVALNLGGLSLLLTLRRQIAFNSRRYSADVRSSQVNNGAGTLPGGAGNTGQVPTGAFGTGTESGVVSPTQSQVQFSPSIPQPRSQTGLDPHSAHRPSIAATLSDGEGEVVGSRRSSTASGGLGSGGVLRQVLLFAGQSRSGGQDQSGGEPGSDSDEKIENRRGSGLMATAKASRGVTVGQLKEKVGEQGPGAADLREQAKQILALKKIKWDLLVFMVCVVTLALMFMSIAIWLAIAGSSILDHWWSVELALFLVPWVYLAGVGSAVTSLTFNAVRHLTAPKRAPVSTIGIGSNLNGAQHQPPGGGAGRAGIGRRGGASISGWTSSFSDDPGPSTSSTPPIVAPQPTSHSKMGSGVRDGSGLGEGGPEPDLSQSSGPRRGSASSAGSLGLGGYNPASSAQRSGEWSNSRGPVLEEEEEDEDDYEDRAPDAQELLTSSGASSTGQETIAMKDLSEDVSASGSSMGGAPDQHTVVTLGRI